MMALKTVIKHRFENRKAKHIAYIAFLVLFAKPYKKTIPTGENVESDYSTWRYIIKSDSDTIKQGNNKITARLLCTGLGGEDIRKWDSISVIGQIGTEKGSESPPGGTLTVPIEIGTTSGISSPTIEIDRDTFVELITKRIGNSSEDIKDSIRDSIVSVYAG
jgi:hypothetical protein